jgi:hypothetical protein
MQRPRLGANFLDALKQAIKIFRGHRLISIALRKDSGKSLWCDGAARECLLSAFLPERPFTGAGRHVAQRLLNSN